MPLGGVAVVIADVICKIRGLYADQMSQQIWECFVKFTERPS